MVRSVCMLLLTLLPLPLAPLALAVNAQASGLDGLAEVAVRYDPGLGTLPDAQGWTYFTDDPLPDDALDASNYSVSGGVLTQGPTGGGSNDSANRQWMISPAFDYDFDDDVVIFDLRLHILQSSITEPPGSGPRAGFGVELVDADGEFVILFVGDTGVFLFSSSSSTSSMGYVSTTAGFADYRLRVDEFGAAVLVDGTEEAYLPRSGFGSSGVPNQLLLGDLTIQERSSSEIQSFELGRAETPVAELRELEWLTFTTPQDSTSPKSTILTCPAGKYVIGGGAGVQGSSGLILNDSHPSGSPPYTQWFARAEEEIASSGSWDLRTDLLCGEIPGQEIVQNTAANSLWDGTVTAQCPDSKVAVGSGASTAPSGGEEIGLRESTPVAPLGTGFQMSAYDFAETLPESLDFDVSAYATCSHARDWVVETASTASDSSSPRTITAYCPFGMVVAGGGARVIGADAAASLVASRPSGAGGPPDPSAWYAEAVETRSTPDPWVLEATAICGSPSEAHVSRDKLAGRWQADLGLGLDDLGKNHGSFENGADTSPGLFDQAFRFERANEEWLRIPGQDFYPAGSFTVEAWFQTSSLVPMDNTTIASLYDIGGDSGVANYSTWILDLTADGYPYAYMRPGSYNSGSTIAGTTALDDGQPHHIALVRDVHALELALYVDGQRVGTDPLSPGIEDSALFPGDIFNIDPISVGAFREGGTTNVIREWEGLVDDVKFYDRALTREDIQNTAGCALPVLPRVLNLDAGRFGATSGASNGHRLCVFLEAGTYDLDLVTPGLDPDARFTAWSPSLTDPWVTAYSAVGEIDPGVTGGSSVGETSAQAAFDGTAIKQEKLVLTADQRVYFSVVDAPPVLDNQGGVSIALPEPGGAATLLTGAGLLHLLHGRRGRPERRRRP